MFEVTVIGIRIFYNFFCLFFIFVLELLFLHQLLYQSCGDFFFYLDDKLSRGSECELKYNIRKENQNHGELINKDYKVIWISEVRIMTEKS